MFWRGLVAAILVGLSYSWIEAQSSTGTTRVNNPDAQRQAMERQQQQRQQSQNEQLVYEELRRRDAGTTGNGARVDKETGERIKQFRKVDPEVVKTYSAFLKIHGTGITKFFPDKGCRSGGIISASDKCRDFIPQSSAFSFRSKDYVDNYYGDIAFEGAGVVAGSFFAQGAILSLGDRPVEGLDLDNPAVKLISTLPPDKDLDAARQTAQRLKIGYASDGITVSTRAKMAVNTTYAVRVTAYRMGTSVPPLSASSTPIEKKFIVLDYDMRGDIVVVFRIVDVKPDGSVTVIWRLLDRKDAPKLKFEKGQALADFRP